MRLIEMIKKHVSNDGDNDGKVSAMINNDDCGSNI